MNVDSVARFGENAELLVIYFCRSVYGVALPLVLYCLAKIGLIILFGRQGWCVFLCPDSISKLLPGYGSRFGSPWLVHKQMICVSAIAASTRTGFLGRTLPSFVVYQSWLMYLHGLATVAS